MDEYLGRGSSKAACQIKAASAEKISKFGAVSICHNAVSYIRPTRIVPNEKLGYCCTSLPNLSKLSFVTLNCPTHLTSEIADIYILYVVFGKCDNMAIPSKPCSVYRIARRLLSGSAVIEEIAALRHFATPTAAFCDALSCQNSRVTEIISVESSTRT